MLPKVNFYRSVNGCFPCLRLSAASRAAQQQENRNTGIVESIRANMTNNLQTSLPGTYKDNFLVLAKTMQCTDVLNQTIRSSGVLLHLEDDQFNALWEWSRHQNENSFFRPFWTHSLSDFLKDLGYTSQELKAAQPLINPDWKEVLRAQGPGFLNTDLAAIPADQQPLYIAIGRKDREAIKRLLNLFGASEDEKQAQANQALHFAILRNDPGLIDFLWTTPEILLPNQNRFTLYKNKDFTPLLLATWLGRIGIVKKLLSLDFGVNFNHKNADGHNALALACYAVQPVVVEVLVNSKYFNVNERDNHGMTPLRIITQQNSLLGRRPHEQDKFNKEKAQIVDLLLHAGADVNQPCHLGFTPLMVAAHSDQHRLVFELLKHGQIDPNAPCESQQNLPVLLTCAQKGSFTSFLLIAMHPKTQRMQTWSCKFTAYEELPFNDYEKRRQIGGFWKKERDAFLTGCTQMLTQDGYSKDELLAIMEPLPAYQPLPAQAPAFAEELHRDPPPYGEQTSRGPLHNFIDWTTRFLRT